MKANAGYVIGVTWPEMEQERYSELYNTDAATIMSMMPTNTADLTTFVPHLHRQRRRVAEAYIRIWK